MRLVLLAFTLALATAAHTQTTWQGLQFGQSRDQAKALLTSQNFEVAVNQDGMLQSVADYDLYLPGFTHAFPFKVNLRFVDDHLTNVDLALDPVAMHANFPELGAEPVTFAGSHLAQALAAKYGRPVFHDFTCDATSHTADCVVTWQGNDQAISLTWFGSHAGVLLRYQMLSADL